jgi:signal peptide peptidase SppA
MRRLPLDRILHRRPVVGIVRLYGPIGAAGRFRFGLTLATLGGLLEQAFSLKRLVAVALLVNSPGGAAAQSSLIYGRIRALAREKGVPVLAFGEDVVASGGYMLACAADEIFVDESSIVGSIGVISAGFGFQDLIARFGVERRVHKAGTQKDMLDPFQPERPEDAAHLETMQRAIHETFVRLVRERRGARLNGGEELFTGAFWAGREAVSLGLADGIGDVRTVLRQRFGDQVRLRAIERRRPWWRRGPVGIGVAADLRDAPTDLPGGLLGALEARALWARFGL